MKKVLLLLSMMVISIIPIAIAQTYTYYTTENTAHNVITSGNVDIQLVEKTLDESGNEIDFPKEGFQGVMPSSTFSKIVRVENIGANDAWVRVYLDVEILDPNGKNLPTIIDADGQKINVVSIDDNKENWTYKDGYYFYNQILKPGETTISLFENVTFAPQMDNTYQGSTINLNVSAEAVQSDNNPIPADGNVTDIPGWPK